MDSNLLQIVNILLSSGVLIGVIAVAVRFGRLEQKVEGHGERMNRVEDHIFGPR